MQAQWEGSSVVRGREMHHIYMIAYLQPEWQSTAVKAYVSISQSIERVWATCVIIFSVEIVNQRTKVDSDCILFARLLMHNIVGEALITGSRNQRTRPGR